MSSWRPKFVGAERRLGKLSWLELAFVSAIEITILAYPWVNKSIRLRPLRIRPGLSPHEARWLSSLHSL